MPRRTRSGDSIAYRVGKSGLFLVGASGLYWLAFVNLPFQDPSPELAARYEFHSAVASSGFWVGLGLLCAGVLAGATRFALDCARGAGK